MTLIALIPLFFLILWMLAPTRKKAAENRELLDDSKEQADR